MPMGMVTQLTTRGIWVGGEGEESFIFSILRTVQDIYATHKNQEVKDHKPRQVIIIISTLNIG